MPLKRNAMPLKRNAMPLAERSIDGSRRNAIPMPGRGLDGPGAERYATGGTQHRRLQAERYTDARAVASMAPGRNAMPLAERSIDGSGGTLYRCRELQGQLWLALGTLLDTMFFDDAQALQFSTGIG